MSRWPRLPTRCAITPATRSAGSKSATPRAIAAIVRAIPDASMTSSTGASSHFAISAVEPASPAGDTPSNTPITPSITATSAPAAARVKVARTASCPIIQPSRLWHAAPVARAW
jgi:hypothetical protein